MADNDSAGQTDRAKDHTNISFTADWHTHAKVLYGVKFAQEVYDALKSKGKDTRDPSKFPMVPVFEGRYNGTDAAMRRYIQTNGIRQVLSLGAGFEPRGIMFASEFSDMHYVETDISEGFQVKSEIADEIFQNNSLPNRKGLEFISADATSNEQILSAVSSFNPDKPVLVVNEGVLSYYDDSEKSQIARIIKPILRRAGGIWITSDPSLNKESRGILFAHISNFREATQKIAERTGRDYDKNGFQSFAHAEQFFNGEGFSVLRHSQGQLGYSLSSLDKLGLEAQDAALVKDRIRWLMEAWAMTPKSS